MRQDIIEDLEAKIKTLTEKNWRDSELTVKKVQDWYKQFDTSEKIDEDFQVQFLFLLSKFIYFGRKEISEMLRSLYRDLYRTRTIHEIRRENGHTMDSYFIEQQFEEELKKTRFLGIGNPSESGSYLLYKFRQENNLAKNLFINVHEIFGFEDRKYSCWNSRRVYSIANPDISQYIFIDDLTCSGSQAKNYSRSVETIKKLSPSAKVHYFVLVATETALSRLEKHTEFDTVDAVFKLDDSFKCFEPESRYYQNEEAHFCKEKTRKECAAIDAKIQEPGYSLGFDKSQLLLGFEHNTPDNAPPVFWSEGTEKMAWQPVFKRYHKKYSG